MTHRATLLFLAELIAVAVNCAIASTICAEPPAKATPDAATTEKLVGELVGPDEARRSAAASRLEAMPEAIAELKKAVNSGDALLEVRAKPVLRECLLRKNRRMAKDYPIDLFLERLLQVDDRYEEESLWRVAAEIGGAILDADRREFIIHRGIKPRLVTVTPVYDFERYLNQFRSEKFFPTLIVGPNERIPKNQRVCVVRGAAIDEPNRGNIASSLLTSPGPIRVMGLTSDTVILGGADVTLGHFGGIVVADGDIRADSLGGLIIARGSVKSKREMSNSVVVVGDKATSPLRRTSVFREGDSKLLGWVRFFEVRDAGLEVMAADDGVKVTRIIDKQPPQVAGLHVGDVITAIDGSDFKDVTQFRRLLRHSTVLKSSKFTVRRDGKTIDINACYVGWEPPGLKKE